MGGLLYQSWEAIDTEKSVACSESISSVEK